MGITEILNEINLLPPKDNIWLIKQVLKSIQDTNSRNELMNAADTMADEYRTNKDLTAFADIDFENFYEAR